MSALLESLRAVVGGAQVLTHGDLSAYEIDWRKRWHGRALAVVRPANTAEVADVVRVCAVHGASLVPQGGNTGLVGGGVPDASGTQVLLSLQRLNRIRELDTANLTLTAEAGCVLQAVQHNAAEAGLLYPLSLASEGSCTIGGTLATNAGGTQVLRYGNARELCLGIEVVTPTGDVWNGLTGLRKDNSGYALRELYIGSEGTLGVITAAVLKLYPAPAAQCTALAACDSPAAALSLLHMAQRHLDADLTAFELMGRHALALVEQHFPTLPRPLEAAPWVVLLESSDAENETHARTRIERLLESAFEIHLISNAVVASSMQQSQQLWQLRESIPLAQAEEGLNIKHDIALPVSRIPAFIASTDAALSQALPGARLVNFGHLGDGNLHYNVQCPSGDDPASFLRTHEASVNALVYDAVLAHGGSISAEHGIGSLKRDSLPHCKSSEALTLMRTLKNALDPQGLMNPGRML